MKELEDLFEKYSFERRTSAPTIAVGGIEEQIGFYLPDDYKYDLNNYQSFVGSIGSSYLWLTGVECLLENNNGYEIFQNVPRMISIGSDGGGEFLGLEITYSGSCRVVLVPYIGMDEQEYNIEIGTSFSDMLFRLDAGREWFS